MWIAARIAVVVPLLLAFAVEPASALKFRTLSATDGRRVLLAYDCGWIEDDYKLGADGKFLRTPEGRIISLCLPWEEGFSYQGTFEVPRGSKQQRTYEGDSIALARLLQRDAAGVAEVWLLSGGGNLFAGIEIGRLLRARRMTVRVPDSGKVERALGRRLLTDASCVSSCTVAFMGGLFRYKDDGATYEVHSASGAAKGLRDEYPPLLRQGKLDQIARNELVQARFMARALFTHFQNALLLYTRLPPRPENDDAFLKEANDLRGMTVPYSSDQMQQDLRRLQSEGIEAAGQDIVMNIERACMSAALDELRSRLQTLGARAEPALRMLDAMYDVSILSTQSLSRQTMLQMGYLTRDVSTEP